MENSFLILKDKYQVLAHQVDAEARLKADQVGNYFIDIAQKHSEKLGLDVNKLMKKGISWVLSRMSLQADEWPHFMDEIVIKTEVVALDQYKTIRTFEVFNQEGDKIIMAYSLWSIINLRKRKAVKLSEVIESDWGELPPTGEFTDFTLPKIQVEKGQVSENLKVRYSDVDILGHLYSMDYISHAQNAIENHISTKQIISIDVNYVQEISYGKEFQVTVKENNDEFFVGFYSGDSIKPYFIANFKLKQ